GANARPTAFEGQLQLVILALAQRIERAMAAPKLLHHLVEFAQVKLFHLPLPPMSWKHGEDQREDADQGYRRDNTGDDGPLARAQQRIAVGVKHRGAPGDRYRGAPRRCRWQNTGG